MLQASEMPSVITKHSSYSALWQGKGDMRDGRAVLLVSGVAHAYPVYHRPKLSSAP